jgi:hypothetical protein
MEMPSKANAYQLSADEVTRMQELVGQLNAAKLQVYEANVQAEAFQKTAQEAVRNVEAAQRIVNGAMAMLCSSQGFKEGQLSPDMKTLTATVL